MRFKIDWASLIGGSKFTVFALFYFVFEGLYLDGRFNEQFFALPIWGAYIWWGSYMEGLIFGILRSLSCENEFYLRMENPFHINVHFGWLASHQGCIEYLHNGDNE